MTTDAVKDWVEILTILSEKKEIPDQTDLEINRRAWELAQSEAQLAHMRALAASPTPSRDPSVFQRVIEEAEALLASEKTKVFSPDPEVSRSVDEVMSAYAKANAAAAIVEALTPLYEQALIDRASRVSHYQ